MEIITAIANDIWQGLIEPLFYFSNAGKRLNIIYLVSAFLLGYYVYRKAKINIPFYRYIFAKKVWLSKSAFVDYKFLFFNGIVKLSLIAPLLAFFNRLHVETLFFLEESFGLATISLSREECIFYYSLSFFILYDFINYLVHFAMHKIPFLWEFHKIHHSATSLNPITQYRIHPGELIINNIARVVTLSFLAGVFDYLCPESINTATYVEAGLFVMLFYFWGANLRHSHIKLSYFPFLERILISPRQHQIHHSSAPEHYDKNMGSKFALWDLLFGTLVTSNSKQKLKYGLGEHEKANYDSFLKNLYAPFMRIGSFPRRTFINIKKRYLHKKTNPS